MSRENEIVMDVSKLDFTPIDFVRLVDKHSLEIKYSRAILVIIGGKTPIYYINGEYRILVHLPLIGIYYSFIPIRMKVQYIQYGEDSKENVIEWSVEYDNFIEWITHHHRSSPMLYCLKEYFSENPITEALFVGRFTL